MIEMKKAFKERALRHGEAARYPHGAEQESSQSLVPLESILGTDELTRRPVRPPDYQTENRALAALAKALADSPRTILQTWLTRSWRSFRPIRPA